MIASVAGEIKGGALTSQRPFRAPHPFREHAQHWWAGVCGAAGKRSRWPTMVSCSSTSFRSSPTLVRSISLRQPLETGEVAIARANHRVTYSRAVHAGRSHEPLPLRPRHGSRLCLHSAARTCAALPITRRGSLDR